MIKLINILLPLIIGFHWPSARRCRPETGSTGETPADCQRRRRDMTDGMLGIKANGKQWLMVVNHSS